MSSLFRDFRGTWLWLVRARALTPLGQLRSLLCWAVVVVCSVGVVLAMLLPNGRSAFQSGPVSSAHGLYQNDCAACHTEAFQTPRRLVPGAKARSVPNAACQHCHPVGGHHASLADAPDCAECHREHRGSMTLTRTKDAHCLNCHATPKGCGSCGEVKFPRVEGIVRSRQVTGFPVGHPPFAPRVDPGKLRFNHAVHTRAEGLPGPDRRTVHLECGHCHTPDESGRYMRSVKYENHCATCHPLSVQLAGKTHDPHVRAAMERFTKEPAPHVSPGQAWATLRGRVENLLRESPVTPSQDAALRREPWPGRNTFAETVWCRAETPMADSPHRAFVQGQMAHLETMLFGGGAGCAFCHLPKNETSGWAVGKLPEYAATSVPDRWLRQARFRHDSHRMVGCVTCHDAGSNHSAHEVLMPSIETCAKCHNPRAGARHDCAGCHTYHERRPTIPAGFPFAPAPGRKP